LSGICCELPHNLACSVSQHGIILIFQALQDLWHEWHYRTQIFNILPQLRKNMKTDIPLFPIVTLESLLSAVQNYRHFFPCFNVIDQTINKIPPCLYNLRILVLRILLIEPFRRPHPRLIHLAAEIVHIEENHPHYSSKGGRHFTVQVRHNRGIVH
jgi:hypothetical protein